MNTRAGARVGASLLAVACLVSACMPGLPRQGTPATATYRVPTDIRFRLARRDFLLHVPPLRLPAAPRALVVVLHGAFSTARQTEEETGFSALADQEGFLVAYPEGIGILGWLQHWNAGHCCGKAAEDDWDDVGFVAEVIRAVQQRFDIDPQRVFLAGMSNGGMLAYRFAAEHSEQVAAIAVVAGAIGSSRGDGAEPWRLPEPRTPLPVLAVHGTDDGHIPYEGGTSPIKGGDQAYLSVAEAMRFWRENNGCTPETHTESRRGGMLERTSCRTCEGNNPVVLYTLRGWAHDWPAPHFTDRRPEGDPLRGLDMTKVLWDFFQNP